MAGNPFAIDWNNREAVIAYCQELNKTANKNRRCCVVITPGIQSYKITFCSKINTPDRLRAVVWTHLTRGPAWDTIPNWPKLPRKEALAISNKFWGMNSV